MPVPSFETDILCCLETLRSGGSILYPTDTIWGIGCDATNETAVAKIFRIKKRTEAKSMIVLIADERDIVKYVSRPEPFIFDFLATVQKPATVIYEGAIGFAENLLAEDGSIGIRIVKEDFCRHLIKRFKKPIVSTSANISGHESPQDFTGISAEILSEVDYIVKYRQEDQSPGVASMLVRFNRNGESIVLRP